MNEKCTEEIKLRVSPRLLLALSRLANAEDRSLSEYLRMVASLHCLVNACRLDECGGACEWCNTPSQGPRNN
ncbi:MAG: hypothetical protein IPG16_23070 [Comamonadaceae bacterium]|nr:hypothetical protein [Comamonadaceae bacterium]